MSSNARLSEPSATLRNGSRTDKAIEFYDVGEISLSDIVPVVVTMHKCTDIGESCMSTGVTVDSSNHALRFRPGTGGLLAVHIGFGT